MLEGLAVKGRFLEDLRQRVRRHRQDDFAQLAEARREVWGSWEERLKRLEQWMTNAAALGRSSADLRAWRDTALGFDRAQALSQKYGSVLESKAASLEKKLLKLAERMQHWADRLVLKEGDLRGFVERQAVKTAEILVSKARKQPYLDFVYVEREE